MTTCGRLVGNELSLVKLRVVCFVAVNTIFDLVSELANKALHGPRCGITKCANGVPLNLVGELFKHVNFGKVGVS